MSRSPVRGPLRDLQGRGGDDPDDDEGDEWTVDEDALWDSVGEEISEGEAERRNAEMEALSGVMPVYRRDQALENVEPGVGAAMASMVDAVEAGAPWDSEDDFLFDEEEAAAEADPLALRRQLAADAAEARAMPQTPGTVSPPPGLFRPPAPYDGLYRPPFRPRDRDEAETHASGRARRVRQRTGPGPAAVARAEAAGVETPEGLHPNLAAAAAAARARPPDLGDAAAEQALRDDRAARHLALARLREPGRPGPPAVRQVPLVDPPQADIPMRWPPALPYGPGSYAPRPWFGEPAALVANYYPYHAWDELPNRAWSQWGHMPGGILGGTEGGRSDRESEWIRNCERLIARGVRPYTLFELHRRFQFDPQSAVGVDHANAHMPGGTPIFPWSTRSHTVVMPDSPGPRRPGEFWLSDRDRAGIIAAGDGDILAQMDYDRSQRRAQAAEIDETTGDTTTHLRPGEHVVHIRGGMMVSPMVRDRILLTEMLYHPWVSPIHPSGQLPWQEGDPSPFSGAEAMATRDRLEGLWNTAMRAHFPEYQFTRHGPGASPATKWNLDDRTQFAGPPQPGHMPGADAPPGTYRR